MTICVVWSSVGMICVGGRAQLATESEARSGNLMRLELGSLFLEMCYLRLRDCLVDQDSLLSPRLP